MKNWLVSALAVAVLATALPTLSEAKRLGGGKSTGLQRNMPARTAPDAPPAKPAAPTQAAPATPAAPAAAPPAAAPKRSWMGPLAGLAAGLGLAALFSHFGLGEGFSNFLMIALLAIAAVFLVRWLMRRFAPQPALATSGSAGPRPQVAWPPADDTLRRTTEPTLEPQAAAPVPSQADSRLDPPTLPVARAFVPAAFDAEAFARTAKLIFIRLQAANDARNLNDLRSFTTPEMFAHLQLDLHERPAGEQVTEIIHVDTQVLDVANEPEQQVVSVRFTGQLREEAGAAPVAFNEVWHLVKPHGDNASWVIAGIEQLVA